MTKAEMRELIERMTDQHGYATSRERETSDALLRAALDGLDDYSNEFVCSSCGSVAIHRSEQ